MLRAVFFDMDGVLYDSMPRHERTWLQTFGEAGIAFTPEEAYLNEGRTGHDTIVGAWRRSRGVEPTEADVERLYRRKTELMRKLVAAEGSPPLLPSMRALLRELPARGVGVFIVTGSRQPSLVGKLTEEFEVPPQHIVTAADVRHGKPDAEPYLRALLLSGCAAAECLVVENAPLGVKSGRAAGLSVWAVNTGKLPNEVLTAAGAERLFHNTTELAEALVGDVG